MTHPNAEAIIIFLHLTNVILDIVGLFFFGAIILATLKQKNLHSACHLLIGLYSLCGFCSKMITTLPFILAIVPHFDGKIPIYFCAIFHLVPVSITFGTFPMMLAIGVDRVFAIFSPIWYKKRSNKKYFAIQFLFFTFYPLYICYVILGKLVKNPKMPSNCLLGLDSNPANYFLMSSYVGLTFCCYLLIFAKILLKSRLQQTPSITQAIFKSLALIIFLQIGCWIFAIILFSFAKKSALNSEQHSIAMYSTLCFISIFTTAEMPLLYFTSSDHRLALEKQFPRIFRFSNKISTNNKEMMTAIVNPLKPLIN